MPVYEMKTVEGQLDETLLTDRLIALLSAGFGLLATLLASIGLYGVMAFVVARRRKELGIRLALGAQRGVVIWLVMREVLLLLASAWRSAFPPRWARAGSSRRSSMASRRAIPGSPAGPWRCSTVVSAAAGLHSGPARQPHRSDPGATPRVTRHGSHGTRNNYLSVLSVQSVARLDALTSRRRTRRHAAPSAPASRDRRAPRSR